MKAINIGEKVSFFIYSGLGKTVKTGIIKGISGEKIRIESDGKEYKVSLDNIID